MRLNCTKNECVLYFICKNYKINNKNEKKNEFIITSKNSLFIFPIENLDEKHVY
jgi:hypothetical protein